MILPTPDIIRRANITRFMSEVGMRDIKTFHQWTVHQYPDFWLRVINQLGIVFKIPQEAICNLSHGLEAPEWLPGAKMNIVDSCFLAPPEAIAIICQNHQQLIALTYAELETLSNRIANSLLALQFKAQDAIAIIMPMNHYAVACYLGIIKIGAMVVSIADSFSSQEISARLKIANAKAVFTQDHIEWAQKILPLYEKICVADAPTAIVLQMEGEVTLKRSQDLSWAKFLLDDQRAVSVACEPMQTCNVLFSSGTTATPKAIPWNHTTPIRAASDAYFHHNLQPGDVLAWPTNLGWMMGPWLIFAALINQATMVLYPETPMDRAF